VAGWQVVHFDADHGFIAGRIGFRALPFQAQESGEPYGSIVATLWGRPPGLRRVCRPASLSGGPAWTPAAGLESRPTLES